jgi:hypothetical protein
MEIEDDKIVPVEYEAEFKLQLCEIKQQPVTWEIVDKWLERVKYKEVDPLSDKERLNVDEAFIFLFNELKKLKDNK